jgi:hypothetical protein
MADALLETHMDAAIRNPPPAPDAQTIACEAPSFEPANVSKELLARQIDIAGPVAARDRSVFRGGKARWRTFHG